MKAMNRLCIIDGKLVLKVCYSAETNARLKDETFGYRWDPVNKLWSFPVDKINAESICKIVFPLQTDEEVDKLIGKRQDLMADEKINQISDKVSPKIKFKTEPFLHQKKAVNFLQGRTFGALLMEMGTGKTKVIIDVLANNSSVNRVLLVCPNSITWNEEAEIAKHSIRPSVVYVVAGLRARRLRLLEEVKALKTDKQIWVIINYEAVRTLKTELQKVPFDAMVCDESIAIKNAQAQCSKAVTVLGRGIKYRYILTGAPITQGPVDIFSQYRFLDGRIFGWSFLNFRAEYCKMGGFNGKQIVGYTNLDILKGKIFEHAIRFTKDDCLDLPAKLYVVREIAMAVKQAEVYHRVKDDILREIEHDSKTKKVTIPIILTKMLRLSQITSGFLGTDDGVVRFKEQPKLEALYEILQSTDQKVVVWVKFVEEIKLIGETLDRLKIRHVDIYSGTEDKQAAVADFNSPEGARVLIGQVHSGGIGINLVSASLVVYYSNSYSLGDRMQSEDRCHRIGQTKNVTYIDLVCKGTIDKSILKALQNKRNLADIVTGEGLKGVITDETDKD